MLYLRVLNKLSNKTSSPYFTLNLRGYSTVGKKLHPKHEGISKSIQDEVLPRVLLQRKITTGDDWTSARTELLNLKTFITPVTIDSLILNFLSRREHYDLANSYVKFLNESGIKLNISTLGKYFRLIYLSNCDCVLEEDKTNEVLSR